MGFLNRLLDAFSQVPAYCRHIMVGDYMVPALVCIIWFLVVIFFTSAVVNVLRRIFIAFAVIACVIGYFRNDYELIWVNIIALIVLLIARLLRHIFVTVRQDRANAQIEAKALAKARKRRGSWENKQAYSGESKPIVFDSDQSSEDADTKNDFEASGSGTTDVSEKPAVSDNTSSKKGTAAPVEDTASKENDLSLQKTAPIPLIPDDEDDESYGNREQILETIRQLKDLKDKGILTEEEYSKKTKELYSRMG